jgi:hypothetical protein
LTGDDIEHVKSLAEQLMRGVANGRATPGLVDEHGVRFYVEFTVTGPAGTARVRSQ